MVSARLLTHAYGQMGEIATAGGFFTYFVVMQLYGFPPSILFGLVSQKAAIPQPDGRGDYDYNYNTPYTYDSVADNLGLSALPLPGKSEYLQNNNFPNWLATTNNKLDLRGIYSNCVNQNYRTYLAFPAESEVLGTYSHISGNYVRYTTESIFYAQSAYFVTVVMVQWSNVFACKSRKVLIHLIIDFFDILWFQQAYVLWSLNRNYFVYLFIVRARS